jgi:GNAT superfamily N-acetyltransferase
MSEIIIGRLQKADWDRLAELIHGSLSAWYSLNLNRPPISAPWSVMRIFPEVYESIDPGCCVTATCEESGKLAGACFYHPRETHISLGIMAIAPNFSGRGVAKTVLAEIVRLAEEAKLPTRLVSSAMNLDSFSLYTRAGFVPQQTFQDLYLPVPESGLPFPLPKLKTRLRWLNLSLRW